MTLSALLLDLGDTLVHGDRVLPHVPEALDALTALEVEGKRLPLALVSDYTMVAPGDRAAAARAVSEYVSRVSAYGLLRHFSPPTLHITLSTEVGVRKPAPAMFTTALARLGLPGELSTAMFVTEEAAHVAAARGLGMTAWRFGSDFTDWSQMPLLVARAIGETDAKRLLAAMALRVRVLFAERVASIEQVDAAAGRVLATLAGDPAQPVELEFDPSGDVVALHHVHETAAERSFRAALEDNAAIAEPGEPLSSGQTHERPPDGGPPRRKRFSIT